MESQPQNPVFRINPENFHPCVVGNHKNHLNEAILMITHSIPFWDEIR